MSFNQEVKEIWTHEPLDLCLNIDRRNIGQRFALHVKSADVALNSKCMALDLHGLHMV